MLDNSIDRVVEKTDSGLSNVDNVSVPNTKMLRLVIVLSWIVLVVTCVALGLIGVALAVMAETFNNRAGAIIVALIALIVIVTLGWTVGGFLKRRWR